MFGHRVPLGGTDAYAGGRWSVLLFAPGVGECGEEYEYGPDEILRVEQSPPESFTPHPLFLDSFGKRPGILCP